MNSEDFKKYLIEKHGNYYGICPPPTDSQEGLNILIEHFLGENWRTSLPINQKQVNTEAIYDILTKYPKKKTFKDLLKDLLIKRR